MKADIMQHAQCTVQLHGLYVSSEFCNILTISLEIGLGGGNVYTINIVYP